jgi:hypothetical protein
MQWLQSVELMAISAITPRGGVQVVNPFDH